MRISKSNTSNAGKGVMIPFGGIFFIVGLLIFYFLTIRPLINCQKAKSWEAVQATVLASEVKSHRDSDGDTTYSVYIRYKYLHNGHTYTGDRYSFMGGSSSGYESKAEKVRQNPPGKEITIYVDPADPAESIIDRSMKWILIIGLFPIIFIVVGAVIMISGFRNLKHRKLDQQQASEHVVRLKGKSRVGKLTGISIFATIWNGAVVFMMIAKAPLLFMAIFGIIGLAVLGGVVHALLGCFNPRPIIEITPGNLHPGTKAALRWRLSGSIDRIQTLNITLNCSHVVTEKRSSGGKTEYRVVHNPLYISELYSSDDHREFAHHALEFEIPSDKPASRTGSVDGIEWMLKFDGDIPKWPDIKEEFKFLVYPQET